VSAVDFRERLRELPSGPGCYVYLDAAGDEIYVGKAKNLKRRVSSYFQRGKGHPATTLRLVQEVADLRILETDSEVEALLLENHLIKELQPRFNIRLKDDKDYPLLAISREAFPRVFITRDRGLSGVDYYGPFGSKTELQRAYHFLMRVFQFRVCTLDIREDDKRRASFRPCLNYHIKRCSAPCTTRIDAAGYAEDVKALRAFLSGRSKGQVVNGLRERMRLASEAMAYEDAARFRDQLKALEGLKERGRLRDYDAPAAPVVAADRGLDAIATALDLVDVPRVIEGFDIAHLMGTDVVASLVQFVDGVPNKDGYRRFKVRGEAGAGDGDPGNDDFAAMNEVVGRRYRRLHNDGQPLPDLVLIDGGLGQVHAAAAAFKDAGIEPPRLIGLAKQEELLIEVDGTEHRLPRRNPGLKLLMYVRDEAHRFSRGYHHLLRDKRFGPAKRIKPSK
jgi:excinuclease ABC subunit C